MKRLLLSFFLSLFVSSAYAQETQSPTSMTAGYSLYVFDTISINNPSGAISGLVDNAAATFTNALKYGVGSWSLLAETYMGVYGEEHSYLTGSLLSISKDFQCSLERDSPARIVWGFMNQNMHYFRGFGSTSVSENWLFFLYPYEFIPDSENPNLFHIAFKNGIYTNPDGVPWKSQALNDPEAFNAAISTWKSVTQFNQVSSTYSPPSSNKGNAYVRDNLIYFNILVKDDPTQCVWDEDLMDWRIVFEDGYVPPSGSNYADIGFGNDVDAEMTMNEIHNVLNPWQLRDHDGDSIPNIYDDDYDPYGDHDSDGTLNYADDDYDSSPKPGEDGYSSPFDLDGDGVMDSIDYDMDGDGVPDTEDSDISLPEEEEYPEYSVGVECVTLQDGSCVDAYQEVETLKDAFEQNVQSVSTVFNSLYDVSALRETQQEPSFIIPGLNMGFLDMPDIEISLPVNILEMFGFFLVMLSTLGAIRIIFE
jgi:hypothetical protein